MNKTGTWVGAAFAVAMLVACTRTAATDKPGSVVSGKEVSGIQTGRFELAQTLESFGGPDILEPKVGKRPVFVEIKSGVITIRFLDGDEKGLEFAGTVKGKTVAIDAKARKGIQWYHKRFTGTIKPDATIQGKLSENSGSIGGTNAPLRTTFNLAYAGK